MKWLRYILHQFYTTYVREFKTVVHDPGVMLFLLFLPLAYPIIYSLIYNPEIVREVKMVVVDDDRSQLSREVVRQMDATQWVHIEGYAANMEEARRAVNSHEAYGILQIPEGFSKDIEQGKAGNANMYAEMSLLLRYKAMLFAATDVMMNYGAELRTQALDNSMVAGEGASLQQYGDPMPMQSVSMGNIAGGFDSFIMPGVLVLILQQCIILSIAMLGGAEHERRKLMPRLEAIAVPYRPRILVTMAAQSMVYLTLLAVPVIFLLHYVPMIFHFPMAGNTLQIFAFILPMIFASVGLGFILQAFTTEREAVFLIWVVTSVIFLFLSGLTWPRSAMAPFWHFVSDLCPGTWGIQGFIQMNGNGASLTQVRQPYYMLWLLALGYGIIAYCVQRWWVKPSAASVTKGD